MAEEEDDDDNVNVEQLSVTLINLLRTTIVLDYIVAHLPLPSLFNLSATSKEVSKLMFQTPGVFRYLDLSQCQGAQAVLDSSPLDSGGNIWRSERMDEALTEDEFYSGPLRGIFSNLERRRLLQHVQVLVLDGIGVTIELLTEVITSDNYVVKLLSVVGCRNLNEGKLQQLLRYICRPERPTGAPKLKGIYVFNKRKISRPRAEHLPAIQSRQQSFEEEMPNDEAWWRGCGQVLELSSKHGLRSGWEQTLAFCEGIVAFDGILCPSKKHRLGENGAGFAVDRPIATVSLDPLGCICCRQFPQLRDGPLRWGHLTPMAFPLLSPLPHSGKLEYAAAPPCGIDADKRLSPSCEQCLIGRWCSECNRYWCENCYVTKITAESPTTGWSATNNRGLQTTNNDEHSKRYSGSIKVPPVTRDCWECGLLCEDCHRPRRRTCRSCKTPYCRIHNTDCDDQYCEWCRLGGRRTRELY